MLTFIAGLVLFFAPHSIAILVPEYRERRVQRLGVGPWKIGYSLLSAIGLVLPVFPLLIATYLPGVIQRRVGHPMLTAVKCWASAHLLANGMLADVLLFALVVWSLHALIIRVPVLAA